MKILKGQLSDLLEIMKIERAAFPIDTYNEDIMTNLINKALKFLIIKPPKNNSILGYLICSKVSAKERNSKKPSILIESIGILPEFQGQGLGKLLISTLLDFFQKRKLESVYLQVNVDNIRAIRLYEQFGFIIEDQLPQYYEESKADAFIMVLRKTE